MYSQVAPPGTILECCTKNETKSDSESQSGKNIQHDEANENVNNESLREKPFHVSEEKWQKFQQLKERRKEVCKPLPDKTRRKRHREHIDINDDACCSQTTKKSKGEILNDNRKAWKELCSNIDANIHLCQDSIAKQKPKSKLEEQLNEALKDSNFSEAEKLSDKISQEELGKKITDAIKMREYKNKKDEEEKWKKSRKKKKLLWRFEQKERWESKGNM